MSLEERISEDIKKAMLAREKDKLEAIRAIKSAILLLKTDKNAGEINEEAEIKLLQKLSKQRKESAEIYKSQNRQDLYEVEVAQMNVINEYLPKQLSVEEITETVKKLIAENNISSQKDMGRLMGLATKTFAGRADNKTVSEIVRSLLS
ncbi:MAG: GatB/YqeY domain-containing protein [Bacteroidales bacterium]|nr:GatB/YqeY domain-containing protein [Bacteroidales bacterium]